MTRLETLKAQRVATLEKMETLNNASAQMTPEQTTEFDALQAQFDKTDREIKLEGMKNVLAADVEDRYNTI